MSLNTIFTLMEQLLGASIVTLELFFLTLFLSLPLGLVLVRARASRQPIINLVTRGFLLVMRGTPLILQLIFVYFALGSMLPFAMPRFVAAVLAFSLNYAAYFAEIYRGGIESISPGQYEAAAVLGFSKSRTFFHIILPQVVKRILPSMGNELMTLIKDTALAQTIGVMEMFRLAQNAASREFSTLPIFIAGFFYLVMNMLVSRGFALAEKKLNYYQ